jgi:hypothetical protein
MGFALPRNSGRYPWNGDMEKIRQKTEELKLAYPVEGTYGSKCSLWTKALNDSLVSGDLYKAAQNYYGTLWNYVGD